ncbi:hypothetical protein JCGZ_25453 [Jatropha curcas]|uniref:Uncharacterized protein n=1 Tax=Jatropha curcas TaxID=180498 RepID=A0A067L7Z1_JATCU|nr:hypothetical protein JCGZ_25453 [Jatropha curcas]
MDLHHRANKGPEYILLLFSFYLLRDFQLPYYSLFSIVTATIPGYPVIGDLRHQVPSPESLPSSATIPARASHPDGGTTTSSLLWPSSPLSDDLPLRCSATEYGWIRANQVSSS